MEPMGHVLNDLDLTGTEYSVYVELLRNDGCLASLIIRKLKLHRATVYDVLNRLVEKGLAGYVIINKKKYYSGTSPEKLNDLLNEREKELESRKLRVKMIVNELSRLRSAEKEKKHAITIYEGREGLKLIMNDILLAKKEFYILGGDELRFQDLLPAYTVFWAKERERLKIYAKKLVTGSKLSNWKYNIEKRVPDEYCMPASVMIFAGKVAIVIKENPLIIIVIESDSVTQSYVSYFNMLWNLF